MSNCAGLVDAIGATENIVLESDFSCTEQIAVGAGQAVTVTGPHVITIDADFSSAVSSLFVNEGSLALDGVTVESQAAGGIRAVHNEGGLSLVGCTFSSLFGTATSMLSVGDLNAQRGRCGEWPARGSPNPQQECCWSDNDWVGERSSLLALIPKLPAACVARLCLTPRLQRPQSFSCAVSALMVV